MIKVEKNTCFGCGACVQKCPKGCISMYPDSVDGFLYPSVDSKICVGCGLCETACPILTKRQSSTAAEAFAVQNRNQSVLSKSSSGGVFSLLAEKVLADSGVVFGARFADDWQVIMDYTEASEGHASMQ